MAKRSDAIKVVFFDYLPNLLFTVLFGSIFVTASFPWMFDYNPIDILLLPLSFAMAMCFYLSPAFCKLPSVFGRIRVLADIGGYELLNWGDSNYSALQRGGAGLVVAIICFFKNIFLIPICAIRFVVRIVLAITCPDVCERSYDSIEFPTDTLVYILTFIALLLSLVPLIITLSVYSAHKYENNIDFQCPNVERTVEKNDTMFGESYNVVTLSFDFEVNVKTDDLQSIECYLVISDGQIELTSNKLRINSGYNNVRFTASNQYADISYDKYSEYNDFNNLKLNALSVKVFVHEILYNNSSIKHSYTNYYSYDIALTNEGRNVNALVYSLLDDGTYSIGYKYNNIKVINCPEYYNNKKVTQVGKFYGCKDLEEVYLSNTITNIVSDAFWECKSLKSIVIPDSVTDIDIGAFHDCSSLESVVLPKNIRELNRDIFLKCSSLREIHIPKTVVMIDKYAFGSCSSLSTIYYEGTVEQWNNIWKGDTWCYLTYGVVECSDGIIPMS